jgi:hypothetical protein
MPAVSAGLAVLAVGAQSKTKTSDGGIASNSRHRCHVQDAPDLGASTGQAALRRVKHRQHSSSALSLPSGSSATAYSKRCYLIRVSIRGDS